MRSEVAEKFDESLLKKSMLNSTSRKHLFIMVYPYRFRAIKAPKLLENWQEGVQMPLRALPERVQAIWQLEDPHQITCKYTQLFLYH
jgi:hypothetical protein